MFVQHQLIVVPVVGLLPRIGDFKPSLNPDEVEAIFDAPLEMFLEVIDRSFFRNLKISDKNSFW